MPSDLERLVSELRAIAAEAEQLRPRLASHASVVRRLAAVIAAAPDGRSAPRGHAVSLLHLASRQCDALAAELANATRAADHFAGRVLGGGGPATTSAPAASAPAPASAPAASAPAPASAPAASAPAPASAPAAEDAGGDAPAERDRPDAEALGAAPAAGDTVDPYVPWWIPNGAPWHGHRGIVPRREGDGSPLTRFSPDDLTLPETARAEPHGGHGVDDVPPSRVPIADTSRHLVSAFVDAGYTGPNCLPQGLVDERSFWMDQAGHATLRHAEVPDSTLMRRALLGWDPITGTDRETGREHRYGRDATTFTSRAALVFAEAQVWLSDRCQRRQSELRDSSVRKLAVFLPAADIFGPDFTEHIRGWSRRGSKNQPAGCDPIAFPEDTQILAVYKRANKNAPWLPYTVFPTREVP